VPLQVLAIGLSELGVVWQTVQPPLTIHLEMARHLPSWPHPFIVVSGHSKFAYRGQWSLQKVNGEVHCNTLKMATGSVLKSFYASIV
jgi:hypothetical protein